MATTAMIYAKRDYSSSSHFINFIQRRIDMENSNFMGLLTGKTGSGKSTSALKICEKSDFDKFTAERIVFSVKDFVGAINSGYPKGSAFLFEEAGVGLHNRNFMTDTNKLASYILQTFRSKNYILILTVPNPDFVDIQGRKLFHCLMETAGINHNEKYVVVKAYFPNHSIFHKKDYHPSLLRVQTEGNTYSVGNIRVGLPSKELLKDYLKLKDEFNDRLHVSSFHKLDSKQLLEKMPTRKKAIYNLYVNQGKSTQEIANLQGIKKSTIQQHIKEMIISGVIKKR